MLYRRLGDVCGANNNCFTRNEQSVQISVKNIKIGRVGLGKTPQSNLSLLHCTSSPLAVLRTMQSLIITVHINVGRVKINNTEVEHKLYFGQGASYPAVSL